jgi:hypothetical protein
VRRRQAVQWLAPAAIGALGRQEFLTYCDQAIGVLVVEAKRRRSIAKRKQATAARRVRALEQRMGVAS